MATVPVEAALGRVEKAGQLVILDGTLALAGREHASHPDPQLPNSLRASRFREKSMASQRLILLCWLFASLGIASTQAWAGKKAVALIQVRTEIPEERRLNVGIHVFGPGLPEDPEAFLEMKVEGVPTDLRRAEARYFPYQLMQTLQSSGYWGTVRVVPDEHIVDVAVSATILTSTAKELNLKVLVQDAWGKFWLRKKYKGRADYSGFYREETRCDPFQSLYNRIANDIREKYVKLEDDDVRRIREISRLRFAAGLVPDAFGDYLSVNKKGRYVIERLPATDDPMMALVVSVRDRDYQFVDIFQEYFAGFHTEMRESYDEWRERCYGKQLIAEKLGRKGVLETLLGVSIIAAGAAVAETIGDDDNEDENDGDDDASDFAAHMVKATTTAAGTLFVEEGSGHSQVARMHRMQLRELSESIDNGVASVLVEFEGEVTRLTGSMEAQYSGWRKILREVFAAETGLSTNPDVLITRGSAVACIEPKPALRAGLQYKQEIQED